jgi:hypothetical protein
MGRVEGVYGVEAPTDRRCADARHLPPGHSLVLAPYHGQGKPRGAMRLTLTRT